MRMIHYHFRFHSPLSLSKYWNGSGLEIGVHFVPQLRLHLVDPVVEVDAAAAAAAAAAAVWSMRS